MCQTPVVHLFIAVHVDTAMFVRGVSVHFSGPVASPCAIVMPVALRHAYLVESSAAKRMVVHVAWVHKRPVQWAKMQYFSKFQLFDKNCYIVAIFATM